MAYDRIFHMRAHTLAHARVCVCLYFFFSPCVSAYLHASLLEWFWSKYTCIIRSNLIRKSSNRILNSKLIFLNKNRITYNQYDSFFNHGDYLGKYSNQIYKVFILHCSIFWSMKLYTIFNLLSVTWLLHWLDLFRLKKYSNDCF